MLHPPTVIHYAADEQQDETNEEKSARDFGGMLDVAQSMTERGEQHANDPRFLSVFARACGKLIAMIRRDASGTTSGGG